MIALFTILLPVQSSEQLIRHTLENGETKEQRATTPESAKSLATSETRRMFSSRSSSEKPRLRLRPWRMLSPSRQYAGMPREMRYSSRPKLTVVFPARHNKFRISTTTTNYDTFPPTHHYHRINAVQLILDIFCFISSVFAMTLLI